MMYFSRGFFLALSFSLITSVIPATSYAADQESEWVQNFLKSRNLVVNPKYAESHIEDYISLIWDPYTSSDFHFFSAYMIGLAWYVKNDPSKYERIVKILDQNESKLVEVYGRYASNFRKIFADLIIVKRMLIEGVFTTFELNTYSLLSEIRTMDVKKGDEGFAQRYLRILFSSFSGYSRDLPEGLRIKIMNLLWEHVKHSELRSLHLTREALLVFIHSEFGNKPSKKLEKLLSVELLRELKAMANYVTSRKNSLGESFHPDPRVESAAGLLQKLVEESPSITGVMCEAQF